MILYHFDNLGFYTGQTSEAPVDKLLTNLRGETKYLVPRGTTSAIPPVPTAGTWPRWNSNAWELAESYKGEYIWIGNARIKCSYHGPLQNGHSLTPPAEIAEKVARAEFKKARASAVAAIVVTVDGMSFDGDEESQGRMARAIAAAASDVEQGPWRLADNTTAMVSCSQLRQALRLAMVAQSQVWFPV